MSMGCHRPPDKPSRFNNLMGTSQADLHEKGAAFRIELQKLKAGVGLPKSAIRGLYNGMDAQLKKVKEQWDDMWPPKGSESGEAFLDAYLKYLDKEKKVLQIAEQITTIAEENAIDNIRRDQQGNVIPNLDPLAQWALISPLIDSMNEEETEALRPLIAKQKDFVKEHNLNLVDPHMLREKKKDD